MCVTRGQEEVDNKRQKLITKNLEDKGGRKYESNGIEWNMMLTEPGKSKTTIKYVVVHS